jgi:hypothetical protein
MFELFDKLVTNRNYFAAGEILSGLGNILTPPADDRPKGFSNAQVHVVPMDDCLHIFMVLDEIKDFNALPGDLTECTDHETLTMLSKNVQLGELWAPQYARGVLLHFLYVHDAQRTTIHAA